MDPQKSLSTLSRSSSAQGWTAMGRHLPNLGWGIRGWGLDFYSQCCRFSEVGDVMYLTPVISVIISLDRGETKV